MNEDRDIEDLWDIDDLLESMKKTKQPTIKIGPKKKKPKKSEVQYFDIEELDV